MLLLLQLLLLPQTIQAQSVHYHWLRQKMRDTTLGVSARRWQEDRCDLPCGLAAEYTGDLGVGEGSQATLWASYTYAPQNGYDTYYDASSSDKPMQHSRSHMLELAPSLRLTFGGGHTIAGGLNVDYGFDCFRADGPNLPSYAMLGNDQEYTNPGGDLRPWLQYEMAFHTGNSPYASSGTSITVTK